jgi:hypothetical protein
VKRECGWQYRKRFAQNITKQGHPMALIKEFADFLVASKQQGTRFTATITLGRQENYLSHDDRLHASASGVVTDPFIDTFCHHVLQTETLDALD